MKLLFKYWKQSKRGMRCGICRIPLIILYQVFNLLVTRYLIKALNAPENVMYTMVVIGSCVGSFIVLIPSVFLGRISTYYFSYDLYRSFEKKILSVDYSIFSDYSTAKLNKLRGDINTIIRCNQQIFNIISFIMSIIVAMYGVFLISPTMIMIVIGIYALFVPVLMTINKRINTLHERMDNAIYERNEESFHDIEGFNEVRCFCMEQHSDSLLEKLNLKVNECAINKYKLVTIFSILVDFIDGFITIMGLFAGLYFVERGLLSVATVIELVTYLWRIINPVVGIVDTIDEFSYALTLVPKFHEFMTCENKVSNGEIELNSFNHSIEFRDVSFSYKDSDKIIKDISFTIKKGDKIGICGSSGEGKSTLIKLLPRFYNPCEGAIYGIDIKSFTLKSMRKLMGVVSQETFIFNGTIMDNIRYGKPNATDDEVMEASKKAFLYDFIKGLENGFQTKVGPRGLKLSGGQRQRLTIARIFLTDPEIIILDEATSALDTESEWFILEAMKEFSDRTIISIAHRLSTIMDSDEIIVIDNHHIVEQGNHDNLLLQEGIYYKLWTMQSKHR